MDSDSGSDRQDTRREKEKTRDKTTKHDDSRSTAVPVSRLLQDPSPSPEHADEQDNNDNGTPTPAKDKEKGKAARTREYRQREDMPKTARQSVLAARESRPLKPAARRIETREASPARPTLLPPPRPVGLDSGHRHDKWTTVPSGNSSCDAPEHSRDAKVSRMLRCVDCSYQICDVCERQSGRKHNVPRQFGVTDPGSQPLSDVRGSQDRPLAAQTTASNQTNADANRSPEEHDSRARSLKETLLAVGRKLVSPERVNDWINFVNHLSEEERRRVVDAYYEHLGQEVDTESDSSEDESQNRYALAYALRQLPGEKLKPQQFARGAPATSNSEAPARSSATATATATASTAPPGTNQRASNSLRSTRKPPFTADGAPNHPCALCRAGTIPGIGRLGQSTAATPQTVPAHHTQAGVAAGQRAFPVPATQPTILPAPTAVPQRQFQPGNPQPLRHQTARPVLQNHLAGSSADPWQSRMQRQAGQIAAAVGLDGTVPQNRRWATLVAVATEALNTLQREDARPVNTGAGVVSTTFDHCTSE